MAKVDNSKLIACSPYIRETVSWQIVRIDVRLLPGEYAVHTECVETIGPPEAIECVSHYNAGKYYRFKINYNESQKTALKKAFNQFMVRSKRLLESDWIHTIVLD